jgi:hypothetical protein
MEVRFRFAPLQYVTVTLFGLIYSGRVQRCFQDINCRMYSVQYAADGKLETREFYEDEISESPVDR